MGMIQNPTKSFTVNKSVNEVKQIINRITEFTKCKLKSSDNIINEYEFDFSTLMVGNIVTMSLNEVSENKTEINLEARRVMGAYDQAIEVTTANLDLKSITKAISTLIDNPKASSPSQIRATQKLENEKKREQKKQERIQKLANMSQTKRFFSKMLVSFLILTFVVGVGFLLYKAAPWTALSWADVAVTVIPLTFFNLFISLFLYGTVFSLVFLL